jgi:PAS domain S-box-containing protein
MGTEGLKKLVEDLRTHQVELEMQNEELREAQIEIEESRSKYADLYDFAPIAFFTLDKEGIITEANLRGAWLLGMERSFFIKKPFNLLVKPESLDHFLSHRHRVLKGNPDSLELELRKKDGSLFFARLESVPSKDGEGNIVQMRSAVVDISERKREEEELRKAHDELEIRVQERTAELTRANQALRESQALLHAVMENTSDPVYVKDRESRILMCNPALEKVAGKPAAEIIGRTDSEYYNDPAIGQVLREHDLSVMESGQSRAWEETAITPEGPRIFISNKAPYRNQSGDLVGIVGISHDITERKKIDQALQESEAKANALIKYAPSGIYELDFRTASFISVNDAMCQVLGYTREELLAMGASQLLEESSRMRFAERIRRRLTGEKVEESVEYRVRKKDGSFIDAVLNISPIPGGKPGRVLVVAHDITDRKRAEEALRESEERFRAIASSTPDHIFIQDQELRYSMVINPQLGLTVEDMIGKTDRDILSPADAEKLTRIKRQVLETGKPIQLEAPLVSSRGDIQFFEGSYIPKFNVRGETEGLIGYFKNITERKQAEEASRRYELLSGHSRDIILFIRRDDLRILEANAAASDAYGYSREELLTLTIADLRAPETRRLTAEQIAEADLRGILFETVHRRKDGSTLPVEVNSRGATVSGSRSLISVIRDITERKQREARIARLTRLYAVLSQVNEAIVRTHTEERLYGEVCRIVAEEGRFPLVWVGRVRDGEVIPEAFCGPASDYLKGIRVQTEGDLGRGPTGTCIREDRPVINDDFDINPLTAPWREPALRFGFRASAALPLRRQGRPEGMLTLYSGEPGAFDPEQVNLLEALCADISYALEAMHQERLRIKAEEDLRRSEARSKVLSQTAGRLLATDDPQGIVNELCREVMAHLDCHTFFNFLADETLSRLHLNAWAGIPEEEARKIEWLDYGGAVCGCVARDGGRIVAEHIPATPDIRTELVKSYGIKAYACHPLLGLGGKVIGTLSFGTRGRETFSEEDLSLMKAVANQVAIAMERMSLIAELQRSKGDLEIKVQERTADLAEANKGLQAEIAKREKAEHQLLQAQKLESIGTLTGGVAHDINNILGPIVINSEMALMDLPKGSGLRNILEMILKSGLRGKDLVRQMLLFGRKSEKRQEVLPFGSLVTETFKLLRSSLPATIQMRLQMETKPEAVYADPSQIQQVIINLCTNAAYAMRGTTGLIDISLQGITFSSMDVPEPDMQPGDYLALSVKDTGSGMDEEVRKRVFEPFFTTKPVGEGTGLGLSVVYGIVKSHKGGITVYSEPGRGSIFRVYLPKAETRVSEKTESLKPVPGGNERILFVDDEEIIVRSMRNMLGRLGYKVMTVTDSEEALRLFSAKPSEFDLVMTDQTMPSMTGEDLGRELMRIRPDISIILCTGYSDLISWEKAMAMGFCGFILKPFTLRESAELVRRILDQRGST